MNIDTEFTDQGTAMAPDCREMFPHAPGHKCPHRLRDNTEWQIRVRVVHSVK